MSKILLIDNFDSFTHILRESLLVAGAEEVDIVPVNQIEPKITANYSKIVISPGPGTPNDNNLPDLIQSIASQKSILGVCLGMQAIVMAYGGQIINLQQVFHGEKRLITTTKSILFKSILSQMEVGLYHSWAVHIETLPKELKATAISGDGILMALEHQSLPIFGVQFHPESYLTKDGLQVLKNWIELKD